MKYITLFVLLFSSFVSTYSQICQNPYVACSSFNNSTLTQCGTSFSYPATTLNNPCIDGTITTNYYCVGYTPQNQNWFVITVTNGNGQELNFEFTNSTNQDINGAIWGPVSSNLSQACYYLNSVPNSCDFDSGNPNLRIQNAYTGQTYIMMLSNHSGFATNINITQPTGGGSVNFCRYIPNENSCQRPTATVLSNKTVVAGQRTQIEVNFTGTPPFYYGLNEGAYEYTTNSNYAALDMWLSDNSFEYKLSHVRNECGTGTVSKDTMYLKLYEKDTVQVSCYQFDGNTKDGVSNNHAKLIGATFTSDRNNNPNKALEFDGIDDYLGMNGRDYPAEQYTISAWVRVNNLPAANSPIQKIVSIGSGSDEQYLGIGNNSQTYNQPGWIVGSKCLDGGNGSTTTSAVANQWVHLCSVKTKDSLRIYINGNQIFNARVALGSYPAYGNNPIARIGCSVNNTQFFNGRIDEIKIFAGALKDKHIRDLYLSTSCEFRLCNNIPNAKFDKPSQLLQPNSYSFSLPVTFSNSNYYLFSFGNEMPKKLPSYTNNYSHYIKSDSSKVINYTLSHFSGSCGTGIVENQAKVIFAPLIKVCLPFDGNTQNSVQGIHGTNNGGTYTTDRFGVTNKALNFNGNSVVSMGIINTGVSFKNYSCGAWISPSLLPLNNQLTIIAQGRYGNDDALMLINNGTNIVLRFQSAINTNYIEQPISINLNQWVHVGVTVIRGYIRLYLNGQLIKQGQISNLSDGLNTNIGGRTAGSLNGFIGKIDDVRLFDGYLSDAQMYDLYQSADCKDRPCTDNSLDLNVPQNLTSEYGNQYGVFDLTFNGAGPWTFSIQNSNQNTATYTAPNEPLFTYSYNVNNNNPLVFKLTSIQNPCQFKEISKDVVINIIPKRQNCYLLNNNGANSNGTINATLYNTIAVNNRENLPNSALEFNGTNSYLEIPSSGLLNYEYSISMWVMPYSLSNGKGCLIAMGDLNKSQYINYEFDDLAQLINWNFSSSAFSSQTTLKTSRGINPNAWHHIVVVRSLTKQQIYVDGQLANEINLNNSGASYNYPSSIFIGKYFNNSNFFNGRIDDVRFFQGSLNSSEVRAIFNSSANSCTFTPCLNYRLSSQNIEGISTLESGKTIETTSKILTNAQVIFDSGNEIIMNPGFKVENGAIFKAIIDGCGGN